MVQILLASKEDSILWQVLSSVLVHWNLLWFLTALVAKIYILYISYWSTKTEPLRCNLLLAFPSHLPQRHSQAVASPTPLFWGFPRSCGLYLDYVFFHLPKINPFSSFWFYLKGHLSGKTWLSRPSPKLCPPPLPPGPPATHGFFKICISFVHSYNLAH